MEGQEDTGWSSSLLKGASEQELEQWTGPWTKNRRPRGSPRNATVLFYNFRQVMALLRAKAWHSIMTESMLALLATDRPVNLR